MADKKPEAKKTEVKVKKGPGDGRYKKYKDGTSSAKHCPKCGEGYYLASHQDRMYCGKCKYTEFGKK